MQISISISALKYAWNFHVNSLADPNRDNLKRFTIELVELV